MWIVIKFKKKDLNIFRAEIKEKLENNLECYLPKVSVEKIIKNKITQVSRYITDDYLFAKINNISEKEVLLKLKYLKGVKYILNHFHCSQLEIEKFVNKCKLHEDDNGNLKSSFFEIVNKTKIQFLNGPFLNQIMNIVENKKNFIKTSLNNINLTVKKKNNFFQAVN
tara:strand:- start:618 stop:1118 length:501 start_codon:yes stop_codon:yes gene_type:complete